MSPSENDLRAALHRGDGEPLDVDRVTASAAATGAARRTRLATVAASVVLVVVAAVTGTALLNRDDTSAPPSAAQGQGTPSSRADDREGAAAPAPSSAGSSTTGPGAGTCPGAFPRRMLPGGGSPGQFGSDGALFERTPTTITVCAYSGTGTLAGLTSVTGRDATALRVSLESASRTVEPCPVAPARVTRTFAFVGVDSTGRAMRVVTTDVAESYCNARTTNGTAVRYGWTPPASLAGRLALLGARVEPHITPSGRNIGSPVR